MVTQRRCISTYVPGTAASYVIVLVSTRPLGKRASGYVTYRDEKWEALHLTPGRRTDEDRRTTPPTVQISYFPVPQYVLPCPAAQISYVHFTEPHHMKLSRGVRPFSGQARYELHKS